MLFPQGGNLGENFDENGNFVSDVVQGSPRIREMRYRKKNVLFCSCASTSPGRKMNLMTSLIVDMSREAPALQFLT